MRKILWRYSYVPILYSFDMGMKTHKYLSIPTRALGHEVKQSVH